jgi:hypothetical protein
MVILLPSLTQVLNDSIQDRPDVGFSQSGKPCDIAVGYSGAVLEGDEFSVARGQLQGK